MASRPPSAPVAWDPRWARLAARDLVANVLGLVGPASAEALAAIARGAVDAETGFRGFALTRLGFSAEEVAEHVDRIALASAPRTEALPAPVEPETLPFGTPAPAAVKTPRTPEEVRDWMRAEGYLDAVITPDVIAFVGGLFARGLDEKKVLDRVSYLDEAGLRAAVAPYRVARILRALGIDGKTDAFVEPLLALARGDATDEQIAVAAQRADRTALPDLSADLVALILRAAPIDGPAPAGDLVEGEALLREIAQRWTPAERAEVAEWARLFIARKEGGIVLWPQVSCLVRIVRNDQIAGEVRTPIARLRAEADRLRSRAEERGIEIDFTPPPEAARRAFAEAMEQAEDLAAAVKKLHLDDGRTATAEPVETEAGAAFKITADGPLLAEEEPHPSSQRRYADAPIHYSPRADRAPESERAGAPPAAVDSPKPPSDPSPIVPPELAPDDFKRPEWVRLAPPFEQRVTHIRPPHNFSGSCAGCGLDFTPHHYVYRLGGLGGETCCGTCAPKRWAGTEGVPAAPATVTGPAVPDLRIPWPPPAAVAPPSHATSLGQVWIGDTRPDPAALAEAMEADRARGWGAVPAWPSAGEKRSAPGYVAEDGTYFPQSSATHTFGGRLRSDVAEGYRREHAAALAAFYGKPARDVTFEEIDRFMQARIEQRVHAGPLHVFGTGGGAPPDAGEALAMAANVGLRLLIESGLLFEINRRVLHPLGLAMQVREEGGQRYFAGVRDARAEGHSSIVFDPEALKTGAAKLDAFLRERGTEAMNDRMREHGFVEQTMPLDLSHRYPAKLDLRWPEAPVEDAPGYTATARVNGGPLWTFRGSTPNGQPLIGEAVRHEPADGASATLIARRTAGNTIVQMVEATGPSKLRVTIGETDPARIVAAVREAMPIPCEVEIDDRRPRLRWPEAETWPVGAGAAERADDRPEPVVEAARELRPVVLRFALAMEERLRANESKGGWSEDTPGALLHRLREEAEELEIELGRGVVRPRAVRREAADVANFAMMIADNGGDLSTADLLAELPPSKAPAHRGGLEGPPPPIGVFMRKHASQEACEREIAQKIRDAIDPGGEPGTPAMMRARLFALVAELEGDPKRATYWQRAGKAAVRRPARFGVTVDTEQGHVPAVELLLTHNERPAVRFELDDPTMGTFRAYVHGYPATSASLLGEGLEEHVRTWVTDAHVASPPADEQIASRRVPWSPPPSMSGTVARDPLLFGLVRRGASADEIIETLTNRIHEMMRDRMREREIEATPFGFAESGGEVIPESVPPRVRAAVLAAALRAAGLPPIAEVRAKLKSGEAAAVELANAVERYKDAERLLSEAIPAPPLCLLSSNEPAALEEKTRILRAPCTCGAGGGVECEHKQAMLAAIPFPPTRAGTPTKLVTITTAYQPSPVDRAALLAGGKLVFQVRVALDRVAGVQAVERLIEAAPPRWMKVPASLRAHLHAIAPPPGLHERKARPAPEDGGDR